MPKVCKGILKVLCIVVLLVLVVVGGYLCYVTLQYSRLEDHMSLTVQTPQTAVLQRGTPYTAATYNIGFGAYDHDFSFFMDSGVMLDGTPVSGQFGRAQSAEIVLRNTEGAIDAITALNPDFCLLQEVDEDATRSFHIDQTALLRSAFPAYGNTYASNFHSAYLAYPLHEMHGSVQAGLLTFSRYNVREAERRSYPVDDSWPTKFFDLDRCFSVLRLPIDGTDAELVLMNSHMSAYDEGGTIRAQQLALLNSVLTEEYEKGNYVIVGGDFNHALCGTVTAFESQQQVPAWVSVLNEEDLAPHFSVVAAENVTEVPTCRSTDMPYQKGVNYTSVLDGFIISDNITATAENIDLDFQYSDHNPAVLTFTLT